MVRKSLKTMPYSLLPFSRPPLLKNLKRRLILSFSEDLKILAGLGRSTDPADELVGGN